MNVALYRFVTVDWFLLWLAVRAAADDEATMQEMKRLNDKVSEMQKQRQMFEQQFRDELLKDDLTATLVTQGDKNQEVWPCCTVLYHVYLYVFFIPVE